MTIEQLIIAVVWTIVVFWIGNLIGYKHGEDVGYDVGWDDGRKYRSPYQEPVDDLSELFPKDEE